MSPRKTHSPPERYHTRVFFSFDAQFTTLIVPIPAVEGWIGKAIFISLTVVFIQLSSTFHFILAPFPVFCSALVLIPLYFYHHHRRDDSPFDENTLSFMYASIHV